MEEKSELFIGSQIFKAIWKNQIGNLVHFLRLYEGGEYFPINSTLFPKVGLSLHSVTLGCPCEKKGVGGANVI